MENSPRENIENTPERMAEEIAEEKLARLLRENFRDFAIRFMNLAEYEELLRRGTFTGCSAYSPKIKAGESPETPPTFQEYLEQCKQSTWDEVIADETDWPQGSMSVNMYNHLLNLLKRAQENVKSETPSKKNYRMRIVNEMKNLLESEIQKEIEVREAVFNDPRMDPQEQLDYIDRRYDIFLLALQLPQLQEKMNTDEEKAKLLLGEKNWLKILSLFESEIRTHRGVWRVMLPETVATEVEDLSLAEQSKIEVRNLLDEIFNDKLQIESFGGETSITLVRKWLEDPASVDLRSVINTVAAAQMSDYEERQYNLALVLDFAALSEEDRSQAYGGWGYIKPNESTARILGAIAIMPSKETLKQIIDLAHGAGTSSHPVFDSRGKVKFPT